MNRLKRLAAVLLNPVEVDADGAAAALEAAGVPVSFADCRNCPNPCDEDSHEDYPNKIVSKIDTTSDMLGSVKPYRRQVVISTGKSDWERSVTNVKDTLAAYITAVEGTAPTPGTSVPGTPQSGLNNYNFEPPRPGVVGIFRDSETNKLSILNGSHDTLSNDNDLETVLVFPDYKVVAEVPRSVEGAQALWDNSVNPTVPRMGSLTEGTSVKSWMIPYSCVILICSHRRRDVRCAVVAPKLVHAFSETLEREGWEVHTQLEHPTGPPLETFNDSEEDKEAEMLRRLQELDEDLPKKALILKTSHIGGHRYAGNVIIYMPQGAGVWYGRVSTHEVEPIVRTTILGGMILPPLLRGGVNLARPDCKKLNDW